MSVEHLVRTVRDQAVACGRLGSPLYAALLDRVADDVLAGGPAAAVLEGHDEDRARSALALRLAGAVHRLALTGEAPALAAHYPSCGGDGDRDAAWRAFRQVLQERAADVRAGLDHPPQTNEVGRAAPLLGGLLHAAGPRPLPVRLWEVGASAGLNLRADRFGYRGADGTSWGPESPVVLSPAWASVPAGAPPALDVVERVGADLEPVDATSQEGALRLASYVWPDQLERLTRLHAAIGVARAHPVRLVRAGAAELLADLDLSRGVLTVVWHSVVWQYLDEAEQRAVLDRLEELGGGADEAGPLAHVAFEPRRGMFDDSYEFRVVVRRWPGGERLDVGAAPPHGLPVTWSAGGPQREENADGPRSRGQHPPLVERLP